MYNDVYDFLITAVRLYPNGRRFSPTHAFRLAQIAAKNNP